MHAIPAQVAEIDNVEIQLTVSADVVQRNSTGPPLRSAPPSRVIMGESIAGEPPPRRSLNPRPSSSPNAIGCQSGRITFSANEIREEADLFVPGCVVGAIRAE